MENLRAIENEFQNLEEIRERLFEPKKIQLHPNIVGFNSPKSYGIYRSTGGDALGVVGDKFQPTSPELFLDSIVNSVYDCGMDLDLSKLTYSEYKKGAIIAFRIQMPTKEIKTPMVGDILERWIEFRTGYNGNQKTTVTETYRRVWCSNGCASPIEQSIGFKNTINNTGKIFALCNHIEKSMQNADNFVWNLEKLVDVKVTQKEIDDFLLKVTGYTGKKYKDLKTRSQNILDSINQSVGIEMSNTGANMFSLLNGVTRYTTHEMAKGDNEALFFDSAQTKNNIAIKTAFAMCGV